MARETSAGPTTARYNLVIASKQGQDVPDVVRLRKALKALSRAYGFRVTSCRPEIAP